MAWQPSPDPAIAGYNIYYGVASHSYMARVSASNATGATVSGLAAGTTYFLAVTASDTSGLESAPSDEISYTVPVLPNGTYDGLFYESDEVRLQSAGFFTVSVTTRGTNSGRLQIGPNRCFFSGQLDPQGLATNVIQRSRANPLTVELQIGTDDEADHIFGCVTDGTWVSALFGERAVFKPGTNPAPYAGSYTIIIPGQDNDPSMPAGDGFGIVRVDGGGVAHFAGTLADGTKVSQSGPLSRNGLWPLYISLYSGKGSIVIWLTFTNQTGNNLNDTLNWIKLADSKARYYPNGFTNRCQMTGSICTSPVGAANPVLNLTNAYLIFSGGNLTSCFTNFVALGPNNKVANLSSNRLTLSFSPFNGTFKGSATDPSTGKSLSFNGAVLQKLNAGYGFLLGTNQSSRVTLAPRVQQ